jgi:hypothetical protein
MPLARRPPFPVVPAKAGTHGEFDRQSWLRLTAFADATKHTTRIPQANSPANIRNENRPQYSMPPPTAASTPQKINCHQRKNPESPQRSTPALAVLSSRLVLARARSSGTRSTITDALVHRVLITVAIPQQRTQPQSQQGAAKNAAPRTARLLGKRVLRCAGRLVLPCRTGWCCRLRALHRCGRRLRRRRRPRPDDSGGLPAGGTPTSRTFSVRLGYGDREGKQQQEDLCEAGAHG